MIVVVVVVIVVHPRSFGAARGTLSHLARFKPYRRDDHVCVCTYAHCTCHGALHYAIARRSGAARRPAGEARGRPEGEEREFEFGNLEAAVDFTNTWKRSSLLLPFNKERRPEGRYS